MIGEQEISSFGKDPQGFSPFPIAISFAAIDDNRTWTRGSLIPPLILYCRKTPRLSIYEEISFLSSGSIPGSSATALLTTADVGWSLAGTEVDGLGSNSIAISSFSVKTSGELEWESLQPRIYTGTVVDVLPDQPDDVVRYQLPAT